MHACIPNAKVWCVIWSARGGVCTAAWCVLLRCTASRSIWFVSVLCWSGWPWSRHVCMPLPPLFFLCSRSLALLAFLRNEHAEKLYNRRQGEGGVLRPAACALSRPSNPRTRTDERTLDGAPTHIFSLGTPVSMHFSVFLRRLSGSGWTLALLAGVLAGCGGRFLPGDRGLSPLSRGVPWAVQSALYGSACYCCCCCWGVAAGECRVVFVAQCDDGLPAPDGGLVRRSPRMIFDVNYEACQVRALRDTSRLFVACTPCYGWGCTRRCNFCPRSQLFFPVNALC